MCCISSSFSARNFLHVLLTQRHFDLHHHAGQICFPGGKEDWEDATTFDTAIRESWEEIGLDKRYIEILGGLDSVITPDSNFHISPWVARISHPYRYHINKREVSDVLEIPISEFGIPTADVQRFDGIEHIIYSYHWEGYTITGATAKILRQLFDLLYMREY